MRRKHRSKVYETKLEFYDTILIYYLKCEPFHFLGNFHTVDLRLQAIRENISHKIQLFAHSAQFAGFSTKLQYVKFQTEFQCKLIPRSTGYKYYFLAKKKSL